MPAGEPRWVDTGAFQFAGEGTEYVRLARGGAGHLRAPAIRLEILDETNPKLVMQTVVMDDLVPVNPEVLQSQFLDFDDMLGHWAARGAGYVAAKGSCPA